MRLRTSAGTLLSLATIATTQELEKRTNNVAIPSAISIAPSQYWDGNDGPWSSFPLQVGGGSTTQDVRVMISTAGYNIFTIAADGCPTGYVTDCTDVRGFIFNPNQSLTWVPESIYGISFEDNLGLGTSAHAGYDDVIFGWQGSGGPKVQHTVIFNVASPKFWQGIFGLNPQPTNFTNLNNPQISFMQSLYENSSIPSVSYGYTAGNQYRLDKVFGSLTLGGYDENRFSGGIQWTMYSDVSRDLLVNIKSITTDNATTTNLLPGGEITAYIDSTVPHIWLPQSACTAFEQAFNLTYDNTTQLYLVDGTTHTTLLESNPTVNITLTNGNQDVTITLPYAAFDLNVSQPIVSDTNYYFPLQRAANDTQYTLGRTFLQEAYLIADYSRQNFTIAPCTWDQNKTSQTSIKSVLSPSLAAVAAQQSNTTSSNHNLPLAALIGIIVGAVVLTVLAAFIAIYILRRKRLERQRQAALEEKVDHYDETLKDGTIVNELGEDAIEEMEAPYYQRARELDGVHKADPQRHGWREIDGVEYRGAEIEGKPRRGLEMSDNDYHGHEMDINERYGNELSTNQSYGHGKYWTHEMDGATTRYELPGSDVQEMSARRSVPLQYPRFSFQSNKF